MEAGDRAGRGPQRLRAVQEPLKRRYRQHPEAARVTLRASAVAGEGATCSVDTGRALARAGLHPATGGDGRSLCSGDMLLQALAACAGVTLSAVADSLGIALRSGRVEAEGDLDFRGTLGLDPDTPVGFSAIRVSLLLDGDLTPGERVRLLERTRRYCVVYQTLLGGCAMAMEAPTA